MCLTIECKGRETRPKINDQSMFNVQGYGSPQPCSSQLRHAACKQRVNRNSRSHGLDSNYGVVGDGGSAKRHVTRIEGFLFLFLRRENHPNVVVSPIKRCWSRPRNEPANAAHDTRKSGGLRGQAGVLIPPVFGRACALGAPWTGFESSVLTCRLQAGVWGPCFL